MSSNPSPDAGYMTLMKILQQRTDILSLIDLPKLSGAIIHYLATLPQDHIELFSHTVATSPSLWGDFPNANGRCDALEVAFRSAVHARFDSVCKSEPKEGAFRRAKKDLAPWTKQAVAGVIAQRPNPEHRLALLSGLLQGVEDHKEHVSGGTRARLEAEVVVAAAELLETLSDGPGNDAANWASEYRNRSESKDRPVVVLRRLGPGALLLSTDRLTLLDLENIARLCIDRLDVLFEDGRFLSKLPSDLTRDPEGLIDVSSDGSFASSMQRVADHPTYNSLSMFSKLFARCLLGLSSQKSTRVAGWKVTTAVVARLENMSSRAEADWARSPLSTITDEKQFAPASKTVMTTLWQILKSFLFSNILISQSILRILTFEPVPSDLSLAPESHPHALASSIISTFFHLSFVTSKFGGGLTSHGGGFSEQKRAFYTALDVVASDAWETELLIKRLAGRLSGLTLEIGHPVREARTSFFLACSEQLMSMLNETVVEHSVLPIAFFHLNRSDYRETYESAHSVVLSIFASHAKARKQSPDDAHDEGIAKKLTPFYARCLLDNANESKLSADQLSLAYAGVVASANSIDHALAQYTIDLLIAAIRTAHSPARLRLTLVALVSAVDATLLPSLLEHIKRAIIETTDPHERSSLKNAVFKQVLEQVSDAEREIAMTWWFDVRDDLDPPSSVEQEGGGSAHGKAEL